MKLLMRKSNHAGHDQLRRFALAPAGQAGFEFIGVLVNLALQLTRREIIYNLRWNMSVLFQTVPIYG
jgi:hypothetical protein